MLTRANLCANIISLDKNILGAFLLRDGILENWKMRRGVRLPELEKVNAMVFQRTLVHTLLKERETYVGKMLYNLTSYEQIDMFHFGVDGSEDRYPLLLVTVRKPYDHELLVAGILRTIKSWRQANWN